jgi:hypothetical protein
MSFVRYCYDVLRLDRDVVLRVENDADESRSSRAGEGKGKGNK